MSTRSECGLWQESPSAIPPPPAQVTHTGGAWCRGAQRGLRAPAASHWAGRQAWHPHAAWAGREEETGVSLMAGDKQTGPRWVARHTGFSVWGRCRGDCATPGVLLGGCTGVKADCFGSRTHCPPLDLGKPCVHQVTSPCGVVGTSATRMDWGERGLCSASRLASDTHIRRPGAPVCAVRPFAAEGHLACSSCGAPVCFSHRAQVQGAGALTATCLSGHRV